MSQLAEQLASCRVLPVVTAHDVDSTVALAEALARGGMTCIEITLRTPAALDSMRAVKQAVPEMVVAAGTVTQPADINCAIAAGADFCVSPGISAALLEASVAQNVPFLPGVSTASEVMLGMTHGVQFFKLFPAVAVGGVELLNSLRGPFPAVQFCPTGGLTRNNFRDFLALPNVVCCGGSWMVAESLVKSGDWDAVQALAAEAMQPA